MIKGGFPRMGETYIGFWKLMELFGYDVTIPEALSKNTIKLGVKHSPEYACWPFKVSLGSIIESLDAGAEVIGTLGGSGPCRAGWYGELQRKILTEDLGYDLKNFYPMYGMKEMMKIAELGGVTGYVNVMKRITEAWHFQKAVESFEKRTLRDRCRELNVGEHTKVFNEVAKMIHEAEGMKELKQVIKHGNDMFEDIPVDREFKPLKVGLVGEIFVVIDPFANLEVERKLGDLGMEVDRSIYVTDWIWREIVLDYNRLTGHFAKKYLHDNASPYLNEPVGGDGIETIAWVNIYKNRGYDGVVEIGPFTCIPEIVAKSIIPTMSGDLDIPVQMFNVDEHTGEAGFITRLEAFGDLLSQRRDGVPLPSRNPVNGKWNVVEAKLLGERL